MNKVTIQISKDSIVNELTNCPYCDSVNIIGHGYQHNGDHPKRMKCDDCGKTFNVKIGTIFYHKKMSKDTIVAIIYLFLTAYPISNMPPLFDITERSIRNLLKEAIQRFKNMKNS